MELACKTMRRDGDYVYVSRYEVIKAFFKTEEEENEDMAKELNTLLNCFCSEEISKAKNISVLPFQEKTYKKAISYIENSLLESV